MKLTERDDEHTISPSPSPDKATVAGPSTSNGHTKNGRVPSFNGTSGLPSSSRTQKLPTARVALPGTKLYEDSYVDREEYIRLVIQSLRDVGYIESAATLEAESGYVMESPVVSELRQCILDAQWGRAEAALLRIGVPDHQTLVQVRYLINQQRYLEVLEQGDTSRALSILRNEIATLDVSPERIQDLSSLLMCADVEELRARAAWDGAAGVSRRALLSRLQRYIPSSLMIPPRRMANLLGQAHAYQRSRCTYHNAPLPGDTSMASGHSLYTDHECDVSSFPRVTTLILEEHTNEVWNLAWNHAGTHLATAGKDKRALVWKIGSEPDLSTRDCSVEWDFSEHAYPINCLAWSTDDTILLTGAEQQIKMWDMKTGTCIRTLATHTETVTALSWLPDNSGFISGAMDRKIILWDAHGKQRDSWGTTTVRVTDLAVTPDMRRVIALGMYRSSPPGHEGATPITPSASSADVSREDHIIVYDFASKQAETTIQLRGELTSVKVSADSQYAIINHATDEVLLLDLDQGCLARKFSGQKQVQHVLRSCFGGVDDNFVASGSEDASVYIWHRESGALLETLPGHGAGSVNAVAWNPRNPRMFASCSDDHTVRVWEAPPPASVAEVLAEMDGPLDGVGKGKGRDWDGYDEGAA